jgi:hypothetical protein
LSSIAAATLLGGVSTALTATASGAIESLDASKHMVTLDNGSIHMAPKIMKSSEFKAGEKVSLNYTKPGHKMDFTSMKPAS